jgi:hypothetical protein
MAKDKPIRIRRAEHSAENRYFLHSREQAQDRGISYEASGLLSYLLSKPSDWVVQPKDLQRKKAGRDKVYGLLNELIAARYLLREIIKDDRQVVRGVDYTVFEEPYPLPENPDTGAPDTENTDSTEYIEEQSTDSTDHLAAQGGPPETPGDSNPDLNGDQDQEKRKSSGKKKKATSVPDPEPGVLDAICLLCYGTRAAWSTNGASIRGCYNKLAKVDSPITVDKLGKFYLWWKANDWRGRKGQKPEPHQVIQTWPVAMSESVNGDKELFGGKTEEDRYDESAWR